MAKQAHRPSKGGNQAAKKPVSNSAERDVVHTSVYLPRPVYEGLREAAFRERRKIHEIMLEGIAMALRKRQPRAKNNASET
jgi:hypothetical protein